MWLGILVCFMAGYIMPRSVFNFLAQKYRALAAKYPAAAAKIQPVVKILFDIACWLQIYLSRAYWQALRVLCWLFAAYNARTSMFKISLEFYCDQAESWIYISEATLDNVDITPLFMFFNTFYDRNLDEFNRFMIAQGYKTSPGMLSIYYMTNAGPKHKRINIHEQTDMLEHCAIPFGELTY